MKLWDKIKGFFFNDEPCLVEQMMAITERDEAEAKKERIEAEIKTELKKRKARKTKRVGTS